MKAETQTIENNEYRLTPTNRFCLTCKVSGSIFHITNKETGHQAYGCLYCSQEEI